MKAIVTKYHGPGNVRGSRISASDEDGNRVSVPYPYGENWRDGSTHIPAVKALCEKMGWHGKLIQGSLKGGYVFVWLRHGPGNASGDGLNGDIIEV